MNSRDNWIRMYKEAWKKYSDVRGRLEGKRKDAGLFKKFLKQFTITPSAEDFMGLMYDLIGKGEQGNRHMKFIKDNLIVRKIRTKKV